VRLRSRWAKAADAGKARDVSLNVCSLGSRCITQKVADAASDIMYGSTELAKETEHGSPASLCSCGAAGYAATAAVGLLCATQGKSW